MHMKVVNSVMCVHSLYYTYLRIYDNTSKWHETAVDKQYIGLVFKHTTEIKMYQQFCIKFVVDLYICVRHRNIQATASLRVRIGYGIKQQETGNIHVSTTWFCSGYCIYQSIQHSCLMRSKSNKFNIKKNKKNSNCEKFNSAHLYVQ